MTLYHAKVPYAWAEKQAETEKERLLHEIDLRDQQIRSLTTRVEHLRLEQGAQLRAVQSRTRELEEKILNCNLVPMACPPRTRPASAPEPVDPYLEQMERKVSQRQKYLAKQQQFRHLVPPGGKIIYQREVPLTAYSAEERRRKFAVWEYPEEHMLSEEEQRRQQQFQCEALQGRVIASNAVVLPSPNHAQGLRGVERAPAVYNYPVPG